MAMTKWEYMKEAVGADVLVARGQEGWELVAVAMGVVFYKRPVDEAALATAAKADAGAAKADAGATKASA